MARPLRQRIWKPRGTAVKYEKLYHAEILGDWEFIMSQTEAQSAHTFHIPVMGTGFTIDTPLRVARYGISSVIALADHFLIEQMRQFHSEKAGLPFEPIGHKEDDCRARRMTAYLNLVDELVRRQSAALQASPFEPGSEITRYFELLPEGPLKTAYREMLATTDPDMKAARQDALRPLAVPGGIDVNIMSKVDGETFRGKEKLPPEYNLAMAALRGYARSTLRSSIIFSAGMNPRLYGYIAEFDDFFPDAAGRIKKKVVLKVSDYRSAEIQGKYLAKRGIWVSEYRIESGLNCGGHAFATDGYLMGPILEEFKSNRAKLADAMFGLYAKALEGRGGFRPEGPLPIRVTVQGGIGTADEDRFLRTYYSVDGTGWGTPFLLVPEVTNVDDEHLQKLMAATDEDVFLSDSSPFGVPFWNLRESASENTRRERIEIGKSGSPCPRGLLKLNTEFTEVGICAASRDYIKRKLASLHDKDLNDEQRRILEETALAKSCICLDLAGGATVKHGIDPKAKPAVCCGPNIVHFSRLASLEEMVGHIYGRLSLLTNGERPHMFVNELRIYVDYLRKEIEKLAQNLAPKQPKYYAEFKQNLLAGIEYYRHLAGEFVEATRERFLEDLNALGAELEDLLVTVEA